MVPMNSITNDGTTIRVCPREQSRVGDGKLQYHPEDLERLLNEFQSIVASREPGEMEARLRRFDGEYRWFLIRVAPLRDENGKIVRWYAASTDIEDRKGGRKIAKDERDLRRITDAIPQTIVVLDPRGVPLYANQAVLDYTGLTAEDVSLPAFVHDSLILKASRRCARNNGRPVSRADFRSKSRNERGGRTASIVGS